MGARLTIGLVLLAAAMLAFGYVSHTAWLIYVSIVCSALAAVFLLISSRQRRAHPEPELDMAWPASLAEPGDARPSRRLPSPPSIVPDRGEGGKEGDQYEAAFAGPERESGAAPGLTRKRAASPTRTVPSPVMASVYATDDGPFEDPAPTPASVVSIFAGPAPGGAKAAKRSPVAADWLRKAPPQQMSARPPKAAAAARPVVAIKPVAAVRPDAAPIAPPVAPLLPADPRATEARPASGPRPAVGPAPAARPAPPSDPGPSAARPAVRRGVPAVHEDYPFPIEDYEYLESDEILPLLSELDDDELVEVLLFELDGPKRADILNRIDALLEGEDWS